MTVTLGREPTPEEIARQAGVPSEKVRLVQEASRKPISLETPVGDDMQLGELIEGTLLSSPTEAVLAEDLSTQVERVWPFGDALMARYPAVALPHRDGGRILPKRHDRNGDVSVGQDPLRPAAVRHDDRSDVLRLHETRSLGDAQCGSTISNRSQGMAVHVSVSPCP